MDNTQGQSPFGSPSSTAGAIHNGVRLRHPVRPEVLAHVCARCVREHEVVRGVVGAHPLRGPYHPRYLGSLRCLRGCTANLVTTLSQHCGVLFGVCNLS